MLFGKEKKKKERKKGYIALFIWLLVEGGRSKEFSQFCIAVRWTLITFFVISIVNHINWYIVIQILMKNEEDWNHTCKESGIFPCFPSTNWQRYITPVNARFLENK
jgi:hypothetical protein